MPLKKSQSDDITFVAKSALIYAGVFDDFQDRDDIAGVRQYHATCLTKFEATDARMIELCDGDEAELTLWADRMHDIREHLNEIERNLAFAGKPQFSWEKVLLAMGALRAYWEAAQNTIGLNSPSTAEAA